MALWNELAVSPLRTSSYTASLQGFGGYSTRYVSEEMTNSLDTLSTALLSETLLFSAIKKCTSLNCTDNISWSLCSCYRSHIYTSFLALSTTYFKYVIAYFWTYISADIPFISFCNYLLFIWKIPKFQFIQNIYFKSFFVCLSEMGHKKKGFSWTVVILT